MIMNYRVARFKHFNPELLNKFAVLSKNGTPICLCKTEAMAEKIAKALNINKDL